MGHPKQEWLQDGAQGIARQPDDFAPQQFYLPTQIPFDLPFGGRTYDPELDHERLSTALGRVWNLMRDGQWRSLSAIALAVSCSEAGASARLRDLRKPIFSAAFPTEAVNSRRVDGGLWVYQVLVPLNLRRSHE